MEFKNEPSSQSSMILPKEVVLFIFSYLNLSELIKFPVLCQQFRSHFLKDTRYLEALLKERIRHGDNISNCVEFFKNKYAIKNKIRKKNIWSKLKIWERDEKEEITKIIVTDNAIKLLQFFKVIPNDVSKYLSDNPLDDLNRVMFSYRQGIINYDIKDLLDDSLSIILEFHAYSCFDACIRTTIIFHGKTPAFNKPRLYSYLANLIPTIEKNNNPYFLNRFIYLILECSKEHTLMKDILLQMQHLDIKEGILITDKDKLLRFFISCVREGELEIVKLLLKIKPDLAKTPITLTTLTINDKEKISDDDVGCSALYFAAKEKSNKVLPILQEYLVDSVENNRSPFEIKQQALNATQTLASLLFQEDLDFSKIDSTNNLLQELLHELNKSSTPSYN